MRSSLTCLSWHANLPAVIWFSYGDTPQMPAECEKFLAHFLWFSWMPCCLYTCTLTFVCTHIHTHLCHIITALLLSTHTSKSIKMTSSLPLQRFIGIHQLTFTNEVFIFKISNWIRIFLMNLHRFFGQKKKIECFRLGLIFHSCHYYFFKFVSRN